MWNHPIDLHFYTSSLAGWPQIVFEVGSLDFYGGKHLRQNTARSRERQRSRKPKTARTSSLLVQFLTSAFVCLCSHFFSCSCSSSLSLSPSPVGYGFCYLPSSSGMHDLEVDIWKPCGAPLEELTDFHLGGGPSLVDTEVIHQVNKAKVLPHTNKQDNDYNDDKNKSVQTERMRRREANTKRAERGVILSSRVSACLALLLFACVSRSSVASPFSVVLFAGGSLSLVHSIRGHRSTPPRSHTAKLSSPSRQGWRQIEDDSNNKQRHELTQLGHFFAHSLLPSLCSPFALL